MTAREAKELCNDALDQLIASRLGPAVSLAADDVRANMTIEFNNRFTRRMGDARVGRFSALRSIRLSTKLFARCDEAQQLDTVTHELAHLVAEVLRPGTGHGRNWQLIHRAMGGSAERLHHVDTTGLGQPRPHVWACGCKDHRVTARKHKTMSNGLRTYRCNTCKAEVIYKGVSNV